MHAGIYSSTRTEDKGIDKEPFKAIQRVYTDLVRGHLQVYKQMKYISVLYTYTSMQLAINTIATQYLATTLGNLQ